MSASAKSTAHLLLLLAGELLILCLHLGFKVCRKQHRKPETKGIRSQDRRVTLQNEKSVCAGLVCVRAYSLLCATFDGLLHSQDGLVLCIVLFLQRLDLIALIRGRCDCHLRNERTGFMWHAGVCACVCMCVCVCAHVV